MELWNSALRFVENVVAGRERMTTQGYITAYTDAYRGTLARGIDAPAMNAALRDMCRKWAGQPRFDALLPKIFGIAERGMVRGIAIPSEIIAEESPGYLQKRRRSAARVIRRGLWRAVQKRRQREILHELHKPGGLGAARGKKRWSEFTSWCKNFPPKTACT